VARIASDEFAVLIENSAGTPSATTLAARINEELSEPVYRDGIGLAVSACVGVVQCQAGSTDHAELLRQSDATLRRAKSKGRRQWAMADRHQDVADRRLFLTAVGMPGELEIGNFRLDYRPLMRLRGDGIAAVQALLRWDHPDRGRLGHDDVVLLAEHTGMVVPLCEWMLNSACHQAQAWLHRFGEPAPPLSVSLPAAQASDPDLVAVVNRALNETGLPAGRLHLSLPARAMLCDEADAEDNLRVLADMGVPTSIHGLGAGPGGLLLVEDQPVTSAWIASWLVQRIADRPTSVTADGLAGLVSLLHTLDVTVVIPDLTTADQVAWWRSVGADVACGDLFARPASGEDLTERLASVLAGQD
jgi:predicted signal transduction protein with EAL and GGDEF domain